MILLALALGYTAGAATILALEVVRARARIRRLEVEARYYLRTNGRSPNRNRSRPGPLSGA